MTATSANPLESWRLAQQPKKLTFAEIGARCGGRSASRARRWCLPFDHPNFEMPSDAAQVLIFEMTGGAVDPNAFVLRGRSTPTGEAA